MARNAWVMATGSDVNANATNVHIFCNVFLSPNKPAKKSHLPFLTGGIGYWELALDSGLWSCPSKQVFSSWAMASSAMICITVAVTEEASPTPTVTVA